MTVFNTKNGVFVTDGVLEHSGLALALSLETFDSKCKKAATKASWREDQAAILKVIEATHTVLAQYDPPNGGRMLNAGGIVTLVNTETRKPEEQ